MRRIYIIIGWILIGLSGRQVALGQDWNHRVIQNETMWFHTAAMTQEDGQMPYSINGTTTFEDCPSADMDLGALIPSGKQVMVYMPGNTIGDLCGDFDHTNSIGFGHYLPEQAALLGASNAIYNTRIEVSWDLFFNEGIAADGYMLFRSESDDNWTEAELTYAVATTWGDVTTFEDNNLKFGTEYYYKVVAFNVSLEAGWISEYSSSVKGTTSGINYNVAAMNEYELRHEITVSYDVFTGFENNSLFFRITDQSLGEEIAGSENGLIDHITEQVGSFWDLSLEAKGSNTQGVYGTLPSSFTDLSGDWTLEMILKVDSLGTFDVSRLVSNDNTALVVIDNQDGKIRFNNESVSENLPMSTWFNLSLVNSAGQLQMYINGTPVLEPITSSEQPKFINGDKNHRHFVQNMDVGMVRAWEGARTRDQLLEDHLDLYRIQGSAPSSMINEWVMDDPAFADVFGFNNGLEGKSDGGTLAFTTTDVESFELEWVESFVLSNIDITIPYTQYVEPGSTHDFLMEIFEVGSGIRHTNTSASATSYTSPAATLNTTNVHKDTVELHFVSASVAEKFEVWRTTGGDPDTRIKIDELEIEEDDRGQVDMILKDFYAFDSDQSIRGGTNYTYEVIPYYEQTSFLDDEIGKVSDSQQALDMDVVATPGVDDIALSWDRTDIATYFTDTVMITRDEEVVARLVGAETYVDQEMTYGKTHTYGIHPVRDGQIVFGQYKDQQVAANGMISGYFIDKRNDLALANISIEASTSIDGTEETITLDANQADGSFIKSSIYYGNQATYRLSDLLGATFELDKDYPQKEVFLKTDSLAPASEDKNLIHNLSWLGDNHSDIENTFSFRWYTEYKDGVVDLHHPDFHLYTNVYRNDELIGIVRGGNNGHETTRLTTWEYKCRPNDGNGSWVLETDSQAIEAYPCSHNKNLYRRERLEEGEAAYIEQSFSDPTGISGEEYAYKFLTYYYDASEEQFHYKDTLLSGVYPKVVAVSDLVAQVSGAGDAIALNFSYTSADQAQVDAFDIYRSYADGDSTLIGALSINNQSTSYAFTDHTGIPGTDYTYQIIVRTGANQSTSSNQVGITYPSVSDNLQVTVASVTSLSNVPGHKIELSINGLDAVHADGHYPVDGVVLYADGQAIDTRSIDQLLGEGTTTRYYQFENRNGSAGDVMAYKYGFYKTNEDLTAIVHKTAFSNEPAFADGGDLPNKTIEITEGEGYVKATWTIDQSDQDKLSLTTERTGLVSGDGFVIELDPAVRSYVFSWLEVLMSWSLNEYNEAGDLLQTKNLEFDGGELSNGSSGFPEIQNLQASTDLSGEVFLTWEYEEFSHAQFEVYRNNILLATVTDHHFIDPWDASIAVNEYHAYQVRAIYDEDEDGQIDYHSSRATAAGMIRVPFTIEGHVYDANGYGVPYIKVNVANSVVLTDSTGYYQLNKLYYPNQESVMLRATWLENAVDLAKDNYQMMVDEVAITLDQTRPVTIHNFRITDDYEVVPSGSTQVADAFALHAYPDADGFSMDLKLQASNGDYDGVEVYRGGRLITEIDNLSDLSWTDRGGESGLDYSYLAIPYVYDNQGERVYGKEKTSITEYYPALEAPKYLVAEIRNGEIELIWRDAVANNGYQILRNEEEIAVLTNGENTFIDETGKAGDVYRYKVHTLRPQEDYIARSSGYEEVTATYPYPMEVISITSVANAATNTTTLSWDYESSADITRVTVERNGKVLSFSEEIPTSIEDTTGIPGIVNTYRITTYRSNDEDAVPSVGQEVQILYPELPAIDTHQVQPDPETMTLTLSWDYEVKTLDGFEVTVTRSGESFTRQVSAVPGQTNYEYTFGQGVSGNSYSFSITPQTTRNDVLYEAPTYNVTEAFPVLPAPVLTVAEQGTEYALITWDYEDFDLDHWSVISPSAQTLEAGERSLLIKGSGSQNISIKAEKIGGTSSAQGTTSVTLDGGSSVDISAAGQEYAVELAISSGSGEAIRLYKNGVLVQTWNTGSNQTYLDEEVNPGERYLYKVEQSGSTNAVLAGPLADPDGQVSGSVTSITGIGIGGVTMRLSGMFDGRLISKEVITRNDGKYFFTGIPYGEDPQEPAVYSVTPVSVDRVITPENQEAFLSSSETTQTVSAFRDESSFTLAGILDYGWKGSKVPDVMVKLFGYTSLNGVAEELGQQESEDGAYSFSRPVDPTYVAYQVQLDTEYHNSQVEDSDQEGPTVADEYYYTYFGQNNGHVRSSLLDATTLRSGDELRASFEDTLRVSTRFAVSTVTGPLNDYRWTLRFRDTSGEVDTTLTTNPAGVLLAQLPPLNYEVNLISVDRKTALAEAVIAYFRPVTIQLAHQDSLKSFTDGIVTKAEVYEKQDELFVTDVDLVFHKVPNIRVSGLEKSDCDVSTDVKDLPVIAGISDDQQDATQVTLDFDVEEDFDGNLGTVTEGYLVVVNNMLPSDPMDTLRYDDSLPAWRKWNPVSEQWDGSYSFEASDLNVIAPYTMLIEVHYFDAHDKYLATELQEVIVTGMKNIGDSDFVTDPDETQFPLFVLRDPPGDASKASIEAGSSLKYNYASKMVYSGSQKVSHKFSSFLFIADTKSELTVGFDQSSTHSENYSFSLDFKESLSTPGSATFDPDRKKYQMGRESDIIVGIGANLLYGVARKASQNTNDACDITEEKIITVDLADISTTWSYTVSEIERNIDYYDKLLNDPEVSFENKDANDQTDIETKWSGIKSNWETIIEWHDYRYRAPANMCRLVQVIREKIDKAKLEDDEENIFIVDKFIDKHRALEKFILGESLDQYKDIEEFCDSDIFKKRNEHIFVNLISREQDKDKNEKEKKYGRVWTEQDFENYKTHSESFQEFWARYAIWELAEKSNTLDFNGAFVKQNDLDRVDTYYAQNESFGDLVENRSFSAGAAYTQTITSSTSIAESVAENLKTSANLGISNSIITEKELVSGSLVLGVINKFGSKSNWSFGFNLAAAFDFSQGWTTGESLKISYTLDDNDPGDHFSTTILHDPTGYDYAATPDFILVAGKSSCPYEEGTIPRDMPQLKAIDEDGVQYPTNYYDLRPFQGSYPIPLQITNLAPFYETRKWGVMQGAHGNVQGLKMVYGQEIIGESASKRLYVHGDEPTYGQLGFGSYGAGLGYDFEDVHVIVGPQCEIANGWVHPETTDTLTFNIHFRRPLPPVGFEQEDNWFITQNVPSWTFGIQNYRLDIRQADFKELWLEYRRTDTDNYNWTKMTDEDGETVLSKEFLQEYFDQFRHIYPYEYYPFAWTPDASILDGNYMIRAAIVHPDGEIGYSPTFPMGTIDRRAPRVVNLPAPTDKVLSRGDVIGVSMDETLNCDYFYAHPELTDLTVYELDGTEYRTLAFHSDPEISEYELRCSGSGIDIIIDEEILGEVDGKDVEFTISGLKDLVGNIADDVIWKFRSDHFKFPVSPIKLYDPSVVLVNKTSESEIPFVMAAMELYENYSVLDSVELQYRKVGTDTYLTYDALTIDEMRSSYELYSPDHTKKPQDTIMLVAAHIPDGEYNFRLVAWGDGRLRTSNGINGTFDRINPFVMNVAPDSRVVDWGDQIRVTYSERMYDRDGLSFSAAIVHDDGSSTDFTNRMQGFINSNWTGFTLNDIDDVLLHAAFGDTLKIELLGVTDYYGNPLEENIITFAIGNFAENVSPVRINTPKTWVMNANMQMVDFMVDNFDLHGTKGKDLDSLKLVYRAANSNQFQEIAHYTIADLRNIYKSGSLAYSEPTVKITWDISNSAISDGSYAVQAVAYGDGGKPLYSNSSNGVIDTKAPWYTGVYSPSDDVLNDTDYFFSFNYSEALNENVLGMVTVSEVVSGVSIPIDPSLYQIVAEGNILKIFPTESFKVIYSDEEVEVYLSGLEDRYGNAQQEDVWVRFTLQDFGYLNTGSRLVTEIEADRKDTGEINVSWTSYDSYDETMIERSRDGVNFIEIARYNGNINSHMDEINFSKLVFYRLKQSIDTTAYYSKTVAVETDHLIPLLVSHTYPMPFDGKAFRLAVMTNNLEDDLEIQVMSTTGMVVATHQINAGVLNNLNVKISFDEPLKPGIYHMQMVQGGKRSYQKLLVAK